MQNGKPGACEPCPAPARAWLWAGADVDAPPERRSGAPGSGRAGAGAAATSAARCASFFWRSFSRARSRNCVAARTQQVTTMQRYTHCALTAQHENQKAS